MADPGDRSGLIALLLLHGVCCGGLLLLAAGGVSAAVLMQWLPWAGAVGIALLITVLLAALLRRRPGTRARTTHSSPGPAGTSETSP